MGVEGDFGLADELAPGTFAWGSVVSCAQAANMNAMNEVIAARDYTPFRRPKIDVYAGLDFRSYHLSQRDANTMFGVPLDLEHVPQTELFVYWGSGFV